LEKIANQLLFSINYEYNSDGYITKRYWEDEYYDCAFTYK